MSPRAFVELLTLRTAEGIDGAAAPYLAKSRRAGECVKLASAFVLVLSSTLANATAPRLQSITPTGAQLGSELEVSFEGDRLQDTEEIITYESGLKVLKLNQVTNKTVKAQLKIEPGCELGEHHLRIRGASGFSELMTFFVGPFPVVNEIEPNNDLQKPQKIELNTTVAGIITSEDVDCFAVQAKKGQRLSAEV